MNDLSLAKKLIKDCQDTQNTYLDLGRCGITDLNDLPELFECVHLETLILSSEWWNGEKGDGSKNKGKSNILSSIPVKISKLKNIKTLIVRGIFFEVWKILDISFLKDLKSLQTLDLSNNQVSDYSFLKDLKSLQALDLSYNKISDISFLKDLKSLQTLDLSNNQVSDYSFLKDLESLQTLDLSYNKISDISFLKALKSLQTLDLSNNQVSDYSFLKALKSLQTLKLSYNKISDISFLKDLKSLQTLDLGRNQISDYSFLKALKSLHTLYLSSNDISNISFLKDLKSLQSLELSLNKISDISFLKNLKSLQILNLYFNKISDVSSLKDLKQLAILNLNNNQISDISSLGNLPELRELYLANNQILDINFLKDSKKLWKFDLRNNKIKELYKSTFELEIEVYVDKAGGRGLCVSGNQIDSPPIEIIKQGRQSVLDWFAAEKAELNEIKIILIGEPKAGKTSLLKMLKENEFKEDEVQTDGVNIVDIAFGDCDTFKKQSSLHKITGHFWDFGGQEIMNATHQFFLTKRSVYVLVLDARKDARNATQIRDWVMRVRATGGDSPIIVVANQIDVNPGFGFINEHDLQKEFPQIKCFVKLSCKTGNNIDLLKEKLAEIIPTAELFNTEIDKKWIKIKDKLQEETKDDDFLNEQRFLTICKEFDLNEKEKQKNAIKFLHDLGLVLHFEDLNLADYYVLNPYWITYGVYQILTSIHVGEKKGIVSMDKLEYIVNEEKDKMDVYNPPDYKEISYTTTERRFLVDILHYFKLCFCTVDRKQFIIPDLLDTKEPLDITEPIKSSSENIRFVYEYDYLPNSIMPNILVEAHTIIKEMWRTGCVLYKDGCNAIISSYEKRITITVSGEHKKKREFMAIIRHIVDLINETLTNYPTALIPLPEIENGFVKYEVLLAREEKGKREYTYDEDLPTEKAFQISKLLEGIPTEDEVMGVFSAFEKLLEKDDAILDAIKETKATVNRIEAKLDSYYEYFKNELPDYQNLQNDIEATIKKLNKIQTKQIVKETTDWLTQAFIALDAVMDDNQKEIYEKFKETDDDVVDVKLNLAVPLMCLLGGLFSNNPEFATLAGMVGANLEATFNIKKWWRKLKGK